MKDVVIVGYLRTAQSRSRPSLANACVGGGQGVATIIEREPS